MQAFKAMELPVARSHWPSGTTELDGQPTGNSEEPVRFLATFSGQQRASKMGKRLGGFLPRPRLIPEIDGNCSGGREKGQGCVKELRNPIKPKIPVGYVSKVRRLLIAGELVVPTSQTSGHAGLQGSWSSRLLGTTGRRGQPNSTVNPLETARNR